VFVKKIYLSSWIFTAMQSVHIRMKSSLSPPLKKIQDPPMLWNHEVQCVAHNLQAFHWLPDW